MILWASPLLTPVPASLGSGAYSQPVVTILHLLGVSFCSINPEEMGGCQHPVPSGGPRSCDCSDYQLLDPTLSLGFTYQLFSYKEETNIEGFQAGKAPKCPVCSSPTSSLGSSSVLRRIGMGARKGIQFLIERQHHELRQGTKFRGPGFLEGRVSSPNL